MTNGRRGAGARVAPPRDELGAHMSIAGGLHRALERGAELACGSVQIFLKNQRQWAAKPMADEDVRAFAAARRATRTAAVFAHASYLINLGAPDDAAWRQAVDVFTDELERGEALGLRCVVIHPGSHMGRGVELGLARVTSALDEATRRTAGYRIRIALENTAGAGNALGRTFGELGELMRRAARPERLGICVDTCHLFTAGYDIPRASRWEAAVEERAKAVGLRSVLAFHLNDAPAPLGWARHLGLLGRWRAHVAQTVGDAVDGSVHADAGLAVAHRDDQVSGLSAHAVEREQRVDVVGHAAAEALEQVTGDPEDHAGLGPVEPDGIDRPLDHARSLHEHELRRVGEREEPLGRRSGGGVLRAQREDTGDQNAEGIAGVIGHDGQRRSCPRAPCAA